MKRKLKIKYFIKFCIIFLNLIINCMNKYGFVNSFKVVGGEKILVVSVNNEFCML